MKIIIKNFGPIYEFEFDTMKNLNVYLGENNIGKSYAISAVYLILKTMLSQIPIRSLMLMEFYYYNQRRFKELGADFKKNITQIEKIENEFIQKIKDNKLTEFNAKQTSENILKEYYSVFILTNLEQSFNTTFDSIESLNNQLNKYSKFEILLEHENHNVKISNRYGHLFVESVSIKKEIIVRKIRANRRLKFESGKIIAYYKIGGENKKGKSGFLNQLSNKIYQESQNQLLDHLKSVYFLPASRSGLYQALSTFSGVIAELSKSRNFLTNKIDFPDISEPVSDYFLHLSKINKADKTTDLAKVASKIEEEILGGEIIFNQKTKKIVFLPDKIDAELDLSNTSSMISEIAPIVAYLKYIVNNKNNEQNFPILFHDIKNKRNINCLIFIEEPEAHLHPKVQVKLMEMFILLVKQNVNITMTSHSNYMFNKLSNLLLEGKILPNEIGSYLMRTSIKGSICDGTIMKAEKDGIIDENFLDVAESLYNERIELFQSMKK